MKNKTLARLLITLLAPLLIIGPATAQVPVPQLPDSTLEIVSPFCDASEDSTGTTTYRLEAIYTVQETGHMVYFEVDGVEAADLTTVTVTYSDAATGAPLGWMTVDSNSRVETRLTEMGQTLPEAVVASFSTVLADEQVTAAVATGCVEAKPCKRPGKLFAKILCLAASVTVCVWVPTFCPALGPTVYSACYNGICEN